MEARSEQFDRSCLHPDESDSRPGIQQPPASALEHTLGGGQGSGDAHGLDQPEMHRGGYWRSIALQFRIDRR